MAARAALKSSCFFDFFYVKLAHCGLANHVVEVFNLLPVAFRTTQSELVEKIRNLAIECYNQHDDSTGSHAILLLSKKFHFKSADLNARLEKAFADIEKIERATGEGIEEA